jgi:hypothetical protein
VLSSPRVLVDTGVGTYIGTHHSRGARCRCEFLHRAHNCSLSTPGSHIVLCGYKSPIDQAEAFVSSADSHAYTGVYQVEDASDCLLANPATGGCKCDGSSAALGILRANVDVQSGGWKGSNVVLCGVVASLSAPFSSSLAALSDSLQITGIYQHDDNVTGGKGCRSPNPTTGSCWCVHLRHASSPCRLLHLNPTPTRCKQGDTMQTFRGLADIAPKGACNFFDSAS